MAVIQFSRGVNETSIPDVKITRSKDGTNGMATFYFENTDILGKESKQEITGMYLIDEEGELSSREVKCKFINGEPKAIEASYIIKSKDEWDRFIRFMERYSKEHDLGFTKSE